MAVATWVVLALVSALIGAELQAWSGPLHRWMVRRAAAAIPGDLRERYVEEWLSELETLPQAPATRLFWASSLFLRRGQMRRAVGATPAGFGWRIKRVLDVGAAGTALVVLLPLLGMIALAARMDGGPGVLFRQVRVGAGGRPFAVLKFRTLRPAEEFGQAHRLSAFGRVVRQTSLDELPQLWNVLRGDMTLVGPRPESPGHYKRFASRIPSYAKRAGFPPGLTGLAQIEGMRGDSSLREQVSRDNHYMDNWSLWLDIKLLCCTFVSVLRQRGH